MYLQDNLVTVFHLFRSDDVGCKILKILCNQNFNTSVIVILSRVFSWMNKSSKVDFLLHRLESLFPMKLDNIVSGCVFYLIVLIFFPLQMSICFITIWEQIHDCKTKDISLNDPILVIT